MRNLKSLRYDKTRPPAQFHGRPLTAVAWHLADPDDAVLCTFGPTADNALIELVRVQTKNDTETFSSITSWDAPCPNPELDCDEVLSLHYFGDSQIACLVFTGGDIVIVREDTLSGEDRIEIVGSVDAGITAAQWSPDDELLAITTKADTVVFMSRGFESIMDISLTAKDLNASNHVSVGWGKKETQFQGKGAKALRDPTMPEKTDEGVISPNDDFKTTITWRGDGSYLAISTIEANLRRIVRVYSREGILDSVSEPVDGLEGALSWRPAGNIIAGIQRMQDRVDVVFFERNGLRHGQFKLRLSQEQVKARDQHIKLLWNSDSSVLAVLMVDCVQFWTMGNYHWYLKQEIRVSGLLKNGSVVWHPERPLRFIAAAQDSFVFIEYIFATARSSILPPEDYGVVAVIDGQSVSLTPFRTANIPPPMALHELTVPSNVIDIAFNFNTSLIAILYDGGISLFGWKDLSASSIAPSLISKLSFSGPNLRDETYLQVVFGEKNRIYALKRCEPCSGSMVFAFNDETGIIEELEFQQHESISSISSISLESSSYAYFQNQNGQLQSLGLEKESWAFSECDIPVYCPRIEVVTRDHALIAFGMSHKGHLFANSRLLVKNCTSFIVTPAHLIFTTTAHLLKFVHITDHNGFEIPPDDPENDERCRSIERGARLVTAMPTSLSLILQMPRGNLETIFPRAMVVAGIRKLIEEKNYRKAFTHCRTQRVDMNVLYDHAPEQFLTCVTLFIDQVKKLNYIDLFLSSLRDEDVTQSMYKETRTIQNIKNNSTDVNGINGSKVIDSGIEKHSKVNKVCDAVLEVLELRRATNLQNIITAHVCKSPPALDDGLMVISQLMKDDSAMADKAVEHICFLADVNKLYDNALGLYDLDLTLLVAQQSQKDPREYLPFMQNLQQMTELRRQFSIDDHLGRHAKALARLDTLDAFTELQAYTQKHSLYQSALSIYRYKATQHATIMALFAQHLESKSCFKEAALAYESLHDYSKATSCYLSSGPSQWLETLFSALSQTPPLSGPALSDLATSLYDALIESKDYFAAGTIQLEYLSSIENAAKSYCKGYFFANAMHLVVSKQRSELLEEVIDPCLGDALATSTELLSECKAQLLAQVPRIRELRLKAVADPLAFYEGERPGDGEVPDDVSVAASSRLSTNRSLFTRYTGKGSQGQSIGTAGTGVSRATSKNRRREERKRARGKKGSVYEEAYLVSSVVRLVERVESVRGDVGKLIEALVRREMWERAKAIEAILSEVIGMCRACVPEVFGSDEPAKSEETVEERAYKPVGGDAVLQESIDAAGKVKVPPLVTTFEKLSLLGA